MIHSLPRIPYLQDAGAGWGSGRGEIPETPPLNSCGVPATQQRPEHHAKSKTGAAASYRSPQRGRVWMLGLEDGEGLGREK